ncbi:MAG TPA: type IV pilus secretin PilQ [Thermoanaerobaculia bacterium]|nr:type IV pilus secretin PilQ [Thermoanaerobaculia bacterium]
MWLLAGAGSSIVAMDGTPLSPVPEATPEDPFIAPPPSGVRASRLEALEVIERGAETRIRIHGDGEFAYQSFQLEDPPRFVLDLDGAVKTERSSSVVIDSAAVERVRMAQYRSEPDPVTRVVFDLRGWSQPWIGRDREGLVVRFARGADWAAAPAEAVTGSLAPSPTEPAAPAEVVTGSLAPSPTEPAAPAPVAAAIQKTAAPEPVAADPAPPLADTSLSSLMLEARVLEIEEIEERGVDRAVAVTQMAAVEPIAAPLAPAAMAAAPAPVERERPILIAQAQPGARPVVLAQEPAPAAPALQVEEPPAEPTLAEGIRVQAPVPEQAEIPRFGVTTVAGERQYFGAPISMSLKDADITEVLRSIARISGLNVVIQPGVSGPVTVELESVPWDQALEQILKINQLGMELEGNILRIAPVARLAQEAEEQQRLQAAKSLSLPLTTVMRRVSYASASEVAAILQRGRGGSGLLSQRATVIVDNRTNTLIIQELPAYMDQVIQIIENLDVPEDQVMIEARIVETTKNWSRALGFAWEFDFIADAAHGNTTGLEFPNNIESTGGVGLLTGGANGFLNIGLGNILNTFELDLILQAAESEGLVNIISAPKVATLNNERASIQSGLQIPVQTVANNTVTVQFVNATLRLDVTPHITAEGTVLLEINIQKREPQPGLAVVGSPSSPIATRDARTRVLVRDGGTAVIGGIYEVSTNESQDRVPGLANIPILGHLFKNRNRSNTNEELLIFITPRIVHL